MNTYVLLLICVLIVSLAGLGSLYYLLNRNAARRRAARRPGR
ncbi:MULTISPECIES: hypothetical protein [unclassified Frankia]|nr:MULTISPECIES: hypothetical protein [unclassified Frankia]